VALPGGSQAKEGTGVNGEVLLQGIVGSQAYGFAHEGSDIDRLGLYAAPTSSFFGLGKPQESYVTTKPDLTLHEAQKWCRLALKCNPTAMELVWLPEGLYEVRHPLGDDLIAIRRSFLSARAVRNSYLGYASSQLSKLKHTAIKMDTHEDPAAVQDRRRKHARHLVRLMLQGVGLHQGDDLVVRLPSPGYVVETASAIVLDPRIGDMLLAGAEKVFDKTSQLPEEPNTVVVEAWLHGVRRSFLE
jgi:hypothetical protein